MNTPLSKSVDVLAGKGITCTGVSFEKKLLL